MPKSAEKHTLVLASASEGRRGLLESISLIPDAIAPADIDETPKKNENPRVFVLRLAKEKALAVADKHKGAYILAGDTIAVNGGKVIGKADSVEEARKTLRGFSGKRHRVLSGVSVIAPDGKQITKCVETMVKFKRLSESELEGYLDSGQWQGKSGCYGIQSRAGGFVESINGSFSNVVGLPLVEVKNMLMGLGYQHPALGNIHPDAD